MYKSDSLDPWLPDFVVDANVIMEVTTGPIHNTGQDRPL